MRKYEILSNEKLFNSWNDLRHGMEQFIDHGRSIVQNDMLLSEYEINRYLKESEKMSADLAAKMRQIQLTTNKYLWESSQI